MAYGPNPRHFRGRTHNRYTADNILIAVGGKPTMPNIPGIEHCIDSDGFFLLEEQPKKVAVIGAGYIAVELAGIFNTLEVQPTLSHTSLSRTRHIEWILSHST